MRTPPTIFKHVSDLNEIIFAHRNKQYGAYELRKHYNDRLLKAFLITISSVLLLLLISFALHRNPPQDKGDSFLLSPDSVRSFRIEEVKVHEPTSHTQTEQAPPVIVNDTAAEHKEKIDSTKVSSSGSSSSSSNDSISKNAASGGKGIAVDTVASVKKAEPDFRLIAEVMPSFPGGEKAFSKYIQRHFNCVGSSISGEKSDRKIILRFVVMNDGSILNVEVLHNDAGADCANQAKNILLNCPKWSPGLQNNQPVNVQLVLPITIMRE